MKYISYRSVIFSVILILFCTNIKAQVFNGDTVLTTQAQIDSFQYVEFNGSITVSEAVPGAITNLNGLTKLDRVAGNLIITRNRDIISINIGAVIGGNLEYSYGQKMTYLHRSGFRVGGSVLFKNVLISVSQFNPVELYYDYFQLDSVGQDFTIDSVTFGYDNSIIIPNLSYIGGNFSITNSVVEELSGFVYLMHVGGNITITNNQTLHQYCAFYRLFTSGYFPGTFTAYGNPVNPTKQEIIDDGICTIELEDDAVLTSQSQIDNFNVHGIHGVLTIEEAIPGDITNLHGLRKLIWCGGVVIKNNTALESLDGLDSVGVVTLSGDGFNIPDAGITIINNASLKSINVFKRIIGMGYGRPADILIGGDLIVEDNPMLTNLEGFSNLRTVGVLSIKNNTSLSNFCALYNLFNEGKVYNGLTISGNASDPTPEGIVEQGPCNDVPASYTAVLLGKNMNPPVITDASGGAMFVLNGRRDTLRYYIRICELNCPIKSVGIYIHRDGSYYLYKDITSEAVIPPGSHDAYIHGMWTNTDSIPFGSPLYYLQSGNLAVKVTTTAYPSGEIIGRLNNNMPSHLFANLDGSQEVPPVNTPGSGEGWFTLSGDGDSLYYNVNVYDLSAPITAAHFHKAHVDSAGPVVKPIAFSDSSHSEGWWTNMDANPLTPELVADLLGCYIYVNVHTSNNPAGEIRGQLYKTDEVPTSFMTLLAAENDADESKYSKLSYYTLEEGKSFHNYEGDITGYDGQKNIVDMTIDIGGNVYLLNNSWTSMLYRIRPEQFDFDGSTVLRAKQMGRLRTSPDDNYVWMTNIQFIKGKLYGFDSKTNKLYNINPNNAHVTEITELSSIGTGTAGFALGADGEVYLLKNIDEKRSEVWKFSKFPSSELTLVTEVPSLGRLKTLSSHPNGNLYAACSENLYEINLNTKTIGILKDHKITASAMDFDYFTEKQTAASGTIPFSSLDGVTDVGDFTETPKKFELSQNYPNPFNPSTTIKYALPEAAYVKLVVYNSLGEVVKTLVNDNRGAGYYETVFDAKDLSSGMYIYRLEAGSYVSTAKMILIK